MNKVVTLIQCNKGYIVYLNECELFEELKSGNPILIQKNI